MEAELFCTLLPLQKSFSHVVKEGPQEGESHSECLTKIYINYDSIQIYSGEESGGMAATPQN